MDRGDFGPVLCVSKFTDEEEALALANAATDYGLAAAVFSSSAERCASVPQGSKRASKIALKSLFNATPSVAKSGFGHELGEAGLEEYIAKKSIVEALDGTAGNGTAPKNA